MKNADGSPRPAPEGHEDLKMPRAGAGDLRPGDEVKQADGTTGTVTRVQNTIETRWMYILDVAVADTFYVGEGQWLVHNCNSILADNNVLVAAERGNANALTLLQKQ